MDKNNEDINLMAKILNPDIKNDSPELSKAIDEIYSVYENEFEPILDKTIMTGLSVHEQEIREALDDLDVLISLPEFIGNASIAFMNFCGKEVGTWIQPLIDSATFSMLYKNGNIPIILSDKVRKRLIAVNDCGNNIEISDKEFGVLTKELWKKKIVIEKLLKTFKLQMRHSYEYFTFTYFPRYADIHADFYTDLISFQDALFLFVPREEQQMKYIDGIVQNWSDKVPIYIVTQEENRERITAHYSRKNFDIINPNQIKDIVLQYHSKRLNVFLKPAIEAAILAIHVKYERRMEKWNTRINRLNADMTGIEDMDLRQSMESSRTLLKKRYSDIELEYHQFKQISRLLLDAAAKIDRILQPSKLVDSKASQKRTRFNRKIFMRAIQSKDNSLISDSLKVLRTEQDKYAYAFSMLADVNRGKTVSQLDITRILQEKNTDLILRIKVELSEKIGLNNDAVMELANLIHDKETANEYYYAGLWFLKNNNKEQAERQLLKSYFKGNENAGEVLFELALKSDDEMKMDKLARLLVPKADYYIATSLKEENNKKINHNIGWFLRLAAAKNYLPAIWELAEDFSSKILRGYYKKDTLEIAARRIGVAENICCYLLENDPYNEKRGMIEEYLGRLFERDGQMLRAVEQLSKCNTATAMFTLGKIYMYGKEDVSQNLDKALEFMNKAQSMGHSKAQEDIAKISSWVQQNAQKRNQANYYNSNNSYYSTTKTTNYHRSSGGCFITSAVCESLNKGDDCAELMAMRKYRDEQKIDNSQIALLIKEYYRVAPTIVDKINDCENRKEIYSRLWSEYIEKTYDAILIHDYAEASKLYIRMTLELSRTYHVELVDEAYQVASRFDN